MAASAVEVEVEVDVVVIGAGQAGLAAGYHLRRRGLVPRQAADTATGALGTFVILDANSEPGGAWQHRWESLSMATVNGIYELPGTRVPEVDPDLPSRVALPAYFADYEERFELAVERPVPVRAVRRQDDDPVGRLVVETDTERLAARYVINATGTWTKPFWPRYPGHDEFQGRQLHVADYVSAEQFAGQRVGIVGAGVSALQLLDEISRVATTFWMTRREPNWVDGKFSTAARIEAIDGVEQRVREGYRPQSIVSVTGMYRGPWVDAADARGALVRHPMFRRLERDGARMPDGALVELDAILWATGFRAAIDHLTPLRLRTRHGGLRVTDGRATDEPRLFLIGYGPSQSTVGANRAGRAAVNAILSEWSPDARVPARGVS